MQKVQQKVIASHNLIVIWRDGSKIIGRVYSAGKNFTGKINPDVILPVKQILSLFYR